MNPSKLIAKIASVIYLSASIGAFFGAGYYRKLADDLFSNAGLVYVTGVITVIIGFLIVAVHNIWTKNWTVLITLLGWLALAKGISLIAFPQFVHTLSERMLTDWGSQISSYAALCLGLLFAYFGFVSGAPVPTSREKTSPPGK
jgi:hypothetical protein